MVGASTASTRLLFHNHRTALHQHVYYFTIFTEGHRTSFFYTIIVSLHLLPADEKPEIALSMNRLLEIADQARQDQLDEMDFDEAMAEIEGPQARAERLLQVAVEELVAVSRGEDAKLRRLVTEMCADMMRDVEEIADALLKEKMRDDRSRKKEMRGLRERDRAREKAERARLKVDREKKRAAEKAQAGLMLSMVAEKENAAQKAREEAFKKAKEEALAKKKVFGRTVGGYLLSGSTPIFLVSQGSLCCRKEPEDFFYTIVL